MLAKIDLRVMTGETVCILGPSGSGKIDAAPLHQLARDAGRGAIFLHGTRIGVKGGQGGHPADERPRARGLRTRIGMVFQHFNLWPHLTALGNIIESPIHVLRRPRKEVIAEAERLSRKWSRR